MLKIFKINLLNLKSKNKYNNLVIHNILFINISKLNLHIVTLIINYDYSLIRFNTFTFFIGTYDKNDVKKNLVAFKIFRALAPRRLNLNHLIIRTYLTYMPKYFVFTGCPCDVILPCLQPIKLY